jgi:hypothetical protein
MLFVGIDWSDRSLDFHARRAEGQELGSGRVKPNVAGLAELYEKLEKHDAASEIAIAVETAQGAWVQALLDRGYAVYPVNPKSADSFREALSAAGNKSDRIDAKVLAMMLIALRDYIRPLRPDAPEIVGLRIACEDRNRLVEEHTAKLNELQAVVKIYYPAFLGLFGGLQSATALEFLKQFPTQEQMLSLTPKKLRSWLKARKYPAVQRLPEMEAHLQAPVLKVASHLQMSKANLIIYLAKSLLVLQAEIDARETDINGQLDRLPEADWVRSLPGAGRTLAPAILACVGRDPERFIDVAEAQALMGTAPVTKASGGMRSVRFRRGCWKFARRTLQLFADQSKKRCAWAKAYYDQQRAKGRKHHETLRSLAHKWLRIILALRRTGQCYDESVFTNSRTKRLSQAAPAVGA